MSLVVPAVLPSSKKDLEEKLLLLSKIKSVNRVQIDVVDGMFASPSSWPYSSPEELQNMVEQNTMLPYLDRFVYEIDLMCFDAERAVEKWLALGATRLTFHAESDTNPKRLLASVRMRYGTGDVVSLGLALNIESDLSLIEKNVSEIAYVQFMGIARIGRQGQPFDRRVLEKIRAFHAKYPEMDIQVDGGVSLENAKELSSIGVSGLVVGSKILKAQNPAKVVEEFEALQTSFGV